MFTDFVEADSDTWNAGYSVISLVLLSCAVNLGILIKEMIVTIKEMIVRLKKRCKKQKKDPIPNSTTYLSENNLLPYANGATSFISD